ncbi:hypothetical protein BSLG_006827 [Batrachochytrium salamandrivorans]|nr:hypothetical protein BSLG_006827 [Batrachochytrium salamandrivorans]
MQFSIACIVVWAALSAYASPPPPTGIDSNASPKSMGKGATPPPPTYSDIDAFPPPPTDIDMADFPPPPTYSNIEEFYANMDSNGFYTGDDSDIEKFYANMYGDASYTGMDDDASYTGDDSDIEEFYANMYGDASYTGMGSNAPPTGRDSDASVDINGDASPTGMGKGDLKDIYEVMIALIKKGPRPTYETREYEDSETEEEDLGPANCKEDDPRDFIDNGEGEGPDRSESTQENIESIRDHFRPFADKKKRCLDQRRYPWYALKQCDYFTLCEIGQENLELMQGVEQRIAKAHKKHSSGLKDLMLHEIALRKVIYRSMKPGETLRDLKVSKAIQERFASLEKEVYECKLREKGQQDLRKYWIGYRSTIDAINNEMRFLGSSPIHRPDVLKKLSWLPKCDSMLKFKIVNGVYHRLV